MKTARQMASLLALMTVCTTAPATNFAVLLGGPDGGKGSSDDKHKDWIIVENVSWSAPIDQQIAAAPNADKGAASDAKDAFRPARNTPKPVVLSIMTANIKGGRSDPFVKGRKLGSIRLRSERNVYVLHGAVVTSVARKGEIEEITLNYTKIENADIPERARQRMSGDPDRPVVSGRAPTTPSGQKQEP